jgi:proteic killer suppression protein
MEEIYENEKFAKSNWFLIQMHLACPQTLWRITSRKLDQLDSVQHLEELNVPPGDRLDKLSGNRKTEFSIRINEQYRICFIWGEPGPTNVEVTDYH